MKLIDKIRAKYPIMAARATKSRKAAIRLFCLACVETAAEVKRCSDTSCPLFVWRFGAIERDETEDDAGTIAEGETEPKPPHKEYLTDEEMEAEDAARRKGELAAGLMSVLRRR